MRFEQADYINVPQLKADHQVIKLPLRNPGGVGRSILKRYCQRTNI